MTVSFSTTPNPSFQKEGTTLAHDSLQGFRATHFTACLYSVQAFGLRAPLPWGGDRGRLL